jgi:glycosyltransferase involved in cell wall biosynthesis
MKICYLADARSIHTQRWVKYFAERGHEVHLISYNHAHIEDVKTYVLPNLKNQFLTLILRFLEVKRLIKSMKPDLVHAHYIAGYGWYGALSRFHPFVATAWGRDIAVDPERSKLYRFLVKYVLKRADLVHTGDEPGKERLIELGCDEGKILIQPMGIDTTRFSPEAKSEDLRRNLGIEDKYSVLCARWFTTGYYVDIFIKAMPYVLKEIPNVRFIICGAGPLESQFKKLVEKLEINNDVVFTGLIPNAEMPKYLASIDVYADTVIHLTNKGGGGIGVTTMEAMACETPHILAKSVSVNDSSNWFHGLTYEPLNPKDLAKKIVHLLKNEELRGEIGKKSRETALEIGDWGKNMKIQEKIYQQLTEGGVNYDCGNTIT